MAQKELGILVIHGMGSQSETFADSMIKKVNKKLGDKKESIVWEPVYWADITERNENRYLKKISHKGLKYFAIRKFVVKALGDAVAYQKTISPKNQTYTRIHKRMEKSVNKVYQALGKDDNKPLIILAHSLGGVIMSNYIWDARKEKSKTGFRQFDSLKCIVTFGCNLPLFSFAYTNPQAVNIPGLKWYNYYDKHDVLGYPLKQISNSYDKVITLDKQINVGKIWSSWNPLAHSDYWTDNDFIKRVSNHINTIVS